MAISGDAPLLVIAAGGTGGHMFPAQALAQEMLSRGWRVTLSTDERGMRYADGFPESVERQVVNSASFSRGGLKAKLLAPLRIISGIYTTFCWFRRARPACVAGFGGYPSLPALAAAVLLRLPCLIHEQNGILGRVNRLFALWVDRVACGIEPVRNAPAKADLVYLGNPVRPEILRASDGPYDAPEQGGAIELLIFGGSQGASVFSYAAQALALFPPELRRVLRVSHQVPQVDVAEITEIYAQAGIFAEIAPFFTDLPDRMASAHLVLARAGASTVAELTVLGRPALLVPYPYAIADHQTANAHALEATGAALVLSDEKMMDNPARLSERLVNMLSDPTHLSQAAAAAKTLGRPDAAVRLAELVLEVAGKYKENT